MAKTAAERIAELQAETAKKIENIKRESVLLSSIQPLIAPYRQPQVMFFRTGTHVSFNAWYSPSLKDLESEKDPDRHLLDGLIELFPPLPVKIVRGTFTSIALDDAPTRQAETTEEILSPWLQVEMEHASLKVQWFAHDPTQDAPYRLSVQLPAHTQRAGRFVGNWYIPSSPTNRHPTPAKLDWNMAPNWRCIKYSSGSAQHLGVSILYRQPEMALSFTGLLNEALAPS